MARMSTPLGRLGQLPNAMRRPRASRAAEPRRMLKNNLTIGVGLLELANACDFPANVWNVIPVPIYAFVLMIIGGTVCLSLTGFAIRDFQLSWHNVGLLRKERAFLRRQQQQRLDQEAKPRLEREVLLDLNWRDLGEQLADRALVDALLGVGGVIVGVGTLMATAGANPKIYLASNLLSGYIGNTPALVAGIVASSWAVYIWFRARLHRRVAHKKLASAAQRALFRRRTVDVQLYAVIRAISVLLAGAASMVTATRWWGYVVLAPCVLASVFTNYYFRKVVGYDRAILPHYHTLDLESLSAKLDETAAALAVLAGPESQAMSTLFPEQKLLSMLEFIVANDLLDAFCVRLKSDVDWDVQCGISTVDLEERLAGGRLTDASAVDVAIATICKDGPPQLLYQQRHLLELYGSYLCHKEHDHAS